jgi:hypothetical protein
VLVGYHGDGRYDLAEIDERRRAAGDEPDHLDDELVFGEGGDLSFFLQPEMGPSHVVVSEDRRAIEVTMAMAGARGDVELRARLALPEPLPPG